VVEIIDGDTIDVDINGQVYRVRYIGMDTPERGMPFFTEATGANEELVGGQTVILVKDVSETDQFGRLLRYVYLLDGTFVNAELVRQGFAQAATYPPDVAHQDLFTQLQQDARNASVGLWDVPTATPVPPTFTPAPLPTNTPVPLPTNTPVPLPTNTPVPLPTNTPVPIPPTDTPAPSQNCDPSYPTVCIPPYPPDLDCGDIPYRRFQVLPPDPHGFDGDNDGIGCESG
jgi:micrococcal nuclease